MQPINDINLLNIDNYPGLTPSELIPPYMFNIHQMFKDLPEDSIEKKAIDTYVRLLEYYFYVSNPSIPNTQYAINFCNNLKLFLDDYLKIKYPNMNIDIEIKGRIKSPVSAIDKFRTEINKTIIKEENLDDLMIKDLFAFRIIVTVFDKNGFVLDDNIAIPYCYEVLEEAMKFAQEEDYITWEKSHPRSTKNPEIVYPFIILPESQPDFVIDNEDYIKDYIMFPKEKTNYQSIHSKLRVEVPGSVRPLFLEMQTRTRLMDDHAEFGPASHLNYKERNIISFSRVPQIFKETEPNGAIRILPLEDSFKEFYGISIEDLMPGLTINNLKEFFELTNYNLPVGLLRINRSDDGRIIPSSAENFFLPIETIGLEKENPTLKEIVQDLFLEEK